MNRSYQHTQFSRTDGSSQMSLSDDEQTQFKPVETLLEKACKAKVSENEYADCIMMDFAGHKEYYSTHQTFLTKNAIYLVLLSLKDENPFDETVDEAGSLLSIANFEKKTKHLKSVFKTFERRTIDN